MVFRRFLFGTFGILAAAGPADADGVYGAVRVFTSFDDNVALVADDQPSWNRDSSQGLGVSGTLGYRFSAGPDTEGRVALEATYLRQTGNEEFDVLALSPSVTLRHEMMVLHLPAEATGRISLQRTLVGDEGFSTVGRISGGIAVRPWPGLNIGPTFGASLHEFDDDGVNPATTSRDAVRVSAAMRAELVVPSTFTTLAATVGYARNFADGDDFDFSNVSLGIDISQPFDVGLGPMTASAGASFSLKEHTNFTQSPSRRQNLVAAQAGLSWQLGAAMALDFGINWQSSEANRSEFSFDRAQATVGLTYSF